jgi:hypothetical protein
MFSISERNEQIEPLQNATFHNHTWEKAEEFNMKQSTNQVNRRFVKASILVENELNPNI